MKLLEVTISVPNSEDRVILVSAKDDQDLFSKLEAKGIGQGQVIKIRDAIPNHDYHDGIIFPSGAPSDLDIV